jgi:hypothetical protein
LLKFSDGFVVLRLGTVDHGRDRQCKYKSLVANGGNDYLHGTGGASRFPLVVA